MERNASILSNREYDLVVVGGGIFGICTVWDAASRGLSVALVERGDFAGATSTQHFKIVHGGIRYLQHGDLYRVRESCRERSALLRVAPHLVHLLPIVMPTYGHGMQGKEILRAGVFLYDLLTLDRNLGISDPRRRIPAGRAISRQACLELFPDLPSDGLTGAVIFHDGQIYNPGRLALSFLKSAVELGADAANYVEAIGLILNGDRVMGIKARDRFTQDEFEVRGRVVINAAGPWADQWLARSLGIELKTKPAFSRDACFVVRRRLLHDKYALAVKARSKDPDAVLSRGYRHLFIVPWRDYTLVGVWHSVHTGAPDDLTIAEHETKGFLAEINAAYPGLELTVEDIAMWNTGLILFGENRPGEKDLSFGKRSIIVDHAADHGIDGLVTMIGVRFTTASGVAAKAVDLSFGKLGKEPAPSRTDVTPVYGGAVAHFDALVRQATAQRPPTISAGVIPALVHNYGSAYADLFKYVENQPGWGETVDSLSRSFNDKRSGASTTIKAEVVHAVRQEMAQTLGDVIFRRTDLGTAGHPGEEALRTCAALMAAELGWPIERVQRELDEVEAAFPPHFKESTNERDDYRRDGVHRFPVGATIS